MDCEYCVCGLGAWWIGSEVGGLWIGLDGFHELAKLGMS
jgi:hypothetical protein